MNPYDGKVCVVTGATSGNGEGIAKALLRRGATVYALGRNHGKLWGMEEMGAIPLYVDLGCLPSITHAASVILEGPKVDYLFHMAGNALYGAPDVYQKGEFYFTDMLAPRRLTHALVDHFNDGGHVAVVTSGSAALGDIAELAYYQKVKREVVKWWFDSYKWLHYKGITSTLISMGVINTGIWHRTEGIDRVTRAVIRKVVPGPKKWTQQILADVAAGEPMSYPGMLASLAPLDGKTGQYRMNPVVKATVTTAARTWLGLGTRLSGLSKRMRGTT